MLLGFKAVPVRALLFQGPDDPLHHAVLLRTVRRDELLLQAIAAHQTGVVAAGKHQAIVRAQQEGHRHTAQGAVADNQSLLRSEEHTSELQSLMSISYAVFCLKKKNTNTNNIN